MKYRTKLEVLSAAVLLASLNWFEAEAGSMGTIRGFVKDVQGNPLAGAAVVVVTETERGQEEKSEKVIKRANTDGDGKFVATGIVPGRYRIKAAAEGYKTVEMGALVKPNKVTVFDSILLRRVGTLAEETRLNADSKYAARSYPGTIFHADEKPAPSTGSDVILASRTRETHGFIEAYTQSGNSPLSGANAFVGSNFAVSQQVGGVADLVVNGQVGYGDRSPRRLEALATATAGDRHRVAVALGYARFTVSRRDNPRSLAQYTVSATDTWQISGPVLVVYGLDASRFSGTASRTTVAPRFGFAFDASPTTRLLGGMGPGSSVDSQSRVSLESGEIVFSDPKPVGLTPSGEPVADRSYRLQFGGQQVLSENSSIELMAFLDTISGHGVGLLAIPLQAGQPEFENRALSARSRGIRIAYHRRLTKAIDGTVGYAFGEGARLNDSALTDPSNIFSQSVFHVVAARVNADFVRTGTKVSAVLRLAPQRAVFAIDPFQGQIETYDPNVSVFVAQELPDFGLVPGQLALVVDLRNLLDQQTSVQDEHQELVASRFHRLVRVGLSLRF
jgi:hypothetical protein